MRKSPILFLGLIGTAISFGWGCGDDGGGSGGAGGGQGEPCERDADCTNTDCSFGFCISGFCEVQVADDGPVPGVEQTEGDCMSIDCVGGEVLERFNGNDTAGDPDGSDCMIPACEEVDGQGMNIMVEEEVGQGCDAGMGDGRCNDMGVCTCEIVNGPQGPVAYVDPVNGQDIPGNGGDNGACAFATIEYALTQAPGEIRLPAIDFNVTGTLSLTGGQWLNCDVNDQENTQTRLIGDGASPVVSFDGMSNGLDDCDVDGQGASAAVLVATAAMGQPHDIRDSIIGNAVDGILVNGGNVNVDNNLIQNNTGVGLNFTATMTNGDLDDNQFVNNGTDVMCADASENVTGDGNQLNSCMTCMNCNF